MPEILIIRRDSEIVGFADPHTAIGALKWFGDNVRAYSMDHAIAHEGYSVEESDGLDCGEGPELAAEMSRLRASCRSIFWLNPLLRFEGFEPRPAGIRAMLPHVDRFLPAHNIASLIDLGRALAELSRAGTQRIH